LAKSINTIKNKLDLRLEGTQSQVADKMGLALAGKLSLLCQQWGNSSALKWVIDCSFVKYLAVMHLNNNFGSKNFVRFDTA
jgi:hypothetical protein